MQYTPPSAYTRAHPHAHPEAVHTAVLDFISTFLRARSLCNTAYGVLAARLVRKSLRRAMSSSASARYPRLMLLQIGLQLLNDRAIQSPLTVHLLKRDIYRSGLDWFTSTPCWTLVLPSYQDAELAVLARTYSQLSRLVDLKVELLVSALRSARNGKSSVGGSDDAIDASVLFVLAPFPLQQARELLMILMEAEFDKLSAWRFPRGDKKNGAPEFHRMAATVRGERMEGERKRKVKER